MGLGVDEHLWPPEGPELRVPERLLKQAQAMGALEADHKNGRLFGVDVPQPAEGQLEGRMRLPEPVDDGPELFHRIAARQTGDVRRPDPVDGGQDAAATGGQLLPGLQLSLGGGSTAVAAAAVLKASTYLFEHGQIDPSIFDGCAN